MINAHKGDHVLIAMGDGKVECHEVTNATYNFITAGKQVFWRTTGQSANGCLEHPYIVRKVSPDKVEFAKEYFGAKPQ